MTRLQFPELLLATAGFFLGLSASIAMAAEPVVANPLTSPASVAQNPMQPMNPMNPMQPGGSSGQSQSDFPRDPEHGNLPVSPGMEDTYYSCTACHSAQTFAQQRLSDARWEYLWDWMIKEQGMPDYGDEMRQIILSYLQRHFSSER